MTTFSDTQRISLYTQHALTGDDWLLISHLVDIEDAQTQEEIASLSFEQFFGLTVHAFMTTTQSSTRQQIAQILPKFGSRAVLSLLKILSYSENLVIERYAVSLAEADVAEIESLALKGLNSMDMTAFVVGLEDAITDTSSALIMPTIVKVLTDAIRKGNGMLLTLLPRLLSTRSWLKLKSHLLSSPSFSAIQASIQSQQQRTALSRSVLNQSVLEQGAESAIASSDYPHERLVNAPSAISA